MTLPELGSDPSPVRPPRTDGGASSPRWCGLPATSGTWASPVRLRSSPPWRAGTVAAVALRKRGSCPAWTRQRPRAGRRARAAGAVGPPPAGSAPRRPSPGSTPTTRPTRSSIAGDLGARREQPLRGTTTAPRAWSASTPTTAASPSGSASEEVALHHFAYFPGAAISGRDLEARAGAVRRLPGARAAVHPAGRSGRRCVSGRRCRGGWCSGCCWWPTRSGCRSAWFGQNDAPSILGVVLAFALVTRGAVRVGGRGAGRGGAAQAVRGGGRAVPGDHDARGGSSGSSAGAVFAGIVAPASLPVLGRGPEGIRGTTRSGPEPAPTGSWATGCRRCWCARGWWRTARARTRSCCSPRCCGCR